MNKSIRRSQQPTHISCPHPIMNQQTSDYLTRLGRLSQRLNKGNLKQIESQNKNKWAKIGTGKYDHTKASQEYHMVCI